MTPDPDVLVVGGGVIGCAVAYELAKRSVQVTLLDKSMPGRATSASAGGLWPVGEAVGLGCGVIYHRSNTNGDPTGMKDEHVAVLPDVFRDYLVRSNDAFPSLAEELMELSGIDIEYEPRAGLLFLIYQEEDQAYVDHIVRSLPTNARPEFLSAKEAREIEPQLTLDLAGAARLVGEHQVNPMLLAEAYKRAAMRLGAVVRHDAHVTGLHRRNGRIEGVQLGPKLITADSVVNAAGCWSQELAATAGLQVPVFPVRGQIVLTETLGHALKTCLSTTGCYMVQKAHGEVLIGSTTEKVGFDVSVTPEAITRLCHASIRAVPMLSRVGIKRVWAGLRPGTPDELPVLGSVDEVSGYYNATGGFRTGIVAAPLTARVVAQCVTGEATEVDISPFLASRFGATAGSRTPTAAQVTSECRSNMR